MFINIHINNFFLINMHSVPYGKLNLLYLLKVRAKGLRRYTITIIFVSYLFYSQLFSLMNSL